MKINQSDKNLERFTIANTQENSANVYQDVLYLLKERKSF